MASSDSEREAVVGASTSRRSTPSNRSDWNWEALLLATAMALVLSFLLPMGAT